MRRFFLMALLGLAVVVVLSACGSAVQEKDSARPLSVPTLPTFEDVLSGPVPPTPTRTFPLGYKPPTLVSPVPTAAVTLSGPVPPTATAVLPPDYKTPTPIPLEQQHFFIAMGNGGLGVPAIPPHRIPGGTETRGITRGDVAQYVQTHQMRGDMVSISYEGPAPAITSIEQVSLIEVYRRFMPEGLGDSWPSPYSSRTPVFLVELSGTFHFSGGPYPGDRGTYRQGLWVFDTRAGYDLLEGGVGRIDISPTPTPGNNIRRHATRTTCKENPHASL